MDVFPLLDFSINEQIEIIKQWHPLLQIHLSTLSKEMQTQVEECLLSFAVMKITLKDDSFIQCFSTKNSELPTITFRHVRHEPHPEMQHTVWDYSINGVDVRCFTSTGEFFVKDTGSVTGTDAFLKILEYLNCLYKCDKLLVETDLNDIADPSIWGVNCKLEAFRILPDSKPWTVDSVATLFENLEIDKFLTSANVFDEEPNVQFSAKFENSFVSLYNPFWVNFDSVLNSTSSSISFHACTSPLSSAKFKLLLHKWFNGGLNQLEIFHECCISQPEEVYSATTYMEEALAGLPTEEYNPNRRAPKHLLPDFTTGIDVRRKDGKHCTICFDSFWLGLFVWPPEKTFGNQEQEAN